MVKLSYKCSCGGLVKYCFYQRGEYKPDLSGRRVHTKGYQVFKCVTCGFTEHRGC